MHPTNAHNGQFGCRLSGVQLDDQVDSDLEVDVSLSGHSDHFADQIVLIAIEPLGSSNKSVSFLQVLEESIGNALLTDSDNVTGLHQVAGNVDAVAVDGKVAMVDQLASLTAGVGKAQTINNIIQSALHVGQQHFTGVALCAGSLVVVVTELLLLNAVDKYE